MRILFIFILVHWANAVSPIFDPYLADSKLCEPWTCINNKLGFPETRPSREQLTGVLGSLLPDSWQDALFDVVSACYADYLPRAYTNTCPGQAMLHCVVDNMIKYCPESNLRKKDACAPLSSLAGFRYMFSQSRYSNLEENLPFDRRPAFFLKNYFSSRCCDLPELFNREVMTQCKFAELVHYFDHTTRVTTSRKVVPSAALRPRPNEAVSLSGLLTDDKKLPQDAAPVAADSSSTEAVKVPKLHFDPLLVPELAAGYQFHTPDDKIIFPRPLTDNEVDPLDCCDLEPFIPSSVRSECDFRTTWSLQLKVEGTPEVTTTTTPPTPKLKYNDVKMVPQSCETETCIFSHLGLVSSSGEVDKQAFSSFLARDGKGRWAPARALAVARCLRRSLDEYEADCELNKIISCVFDVLSENCPHTKKKFEDPCKQAVPPGNNTICQVSSSKYGPKRRRTYCDPPRLVPAATLRRCSAASVTRMVAAPAHPAAANRPAPPQCQEATKSTNCLLSKMGVLNKYTFMDHFKMKDRIRDFTERYSEWASSAPTYMPRMLRTQSYAAHCSTPKKLLNVVEAMLATCPINRRKSTKQCKKLFEDIATVQNSTQTAQELIKTFIESTPKKRYAQNGHKPHAHYEENLPPTKVIKVAPQVMSMKPKNSGILVRKPVYTEMTPAPFKNMADLPPKPVIPPIPESFDSNSMLRSEYEGLPVV